MANADQRVLADSVVTAIAANRGKTAAQIALRWAVQRGTVAIPKTQTVAHLEENLAIYDFALTDDEMRQIDSLDRHRRFNDPAEFGEAAFNTFYPIFD